MHAVRPFAVLGKHACKVAHHEHTCSESEPQTRTFTVFRLQIRLLFTVGLHIFYTFWADQNFSP